MQLNTNVLTPVQNLTSIRPSQEFTPSIEVTNLSAWYGKHQVLDSVSLKVKKSGITALIGPSGCGKSTFIRCLNRLHEEVPGARVEGTVLLEGASVYGNSVDPVAIRRRIGMVFQKPNPFPVMSISENVSAGLRLDGIRDKALLSSRVEAALRQAALWEEVKDKLKAPATSLSGGQQQRLCIARALAVQPPVLLMDEPTSALDPISTGKIEELLMELRKTVSIVIVTHNMQQAARISDQTAFFLTGEMVESGQTTSVFSDAKDQRTRDYISGRFG